MIKRVHTSWIEKIETLASDITAGDSRGLSAKKRENHLLEKGLRQFVLKSNFKKKHFYCSVNVHPCDCI